MEPLDGETPVKHLLATKSEEKHKENKIFHSYQIPSILDIKSNLTTLANELELVIESRESLIIKLK